MTDSRSYFYEVPGSHSEEYPTALASRIASRFDLTPPVEVFDFPERGNINQHTYLVTDRLSDKGPSYLLQQINQQVFVRPRSVMASMIRCIETQRRNQKKGLLPPGVEWETISLVSTRRDGEAFLETEDWKGKSFWRLMRKISGCRTFKSLGELSSRTEQLGLAEEAGRGLAIYGDLTADMKIEGLSNPLPGYRDTRLYYRQLESVLRGCRDYGECLDLLPEDPETRESTGEHFLVHLPDAELKRRRTLPDVEHYLSMIRSQESFAYTLLEGMERGTIRKLAIHGDTKLDNFLFNETTNRVKALVDLDTIMPHTWLADWGDMVRSLSNVAGEKERKQDRIGVDKGIFEAIARGFLTTSKTVLKEEIEQMVEAVQIIALELGTRFLTDYLRGDSYFRLSPTDPPDLNRVRGGGQLTLFLRLRENQEELEEMIQRFSERGPAE